MSEFETREDERSSFSFFRSLGMLAFSRKRPVVVDEDEKNTMAVDHIDQWMTFGRWDVATKSQGMLCAINKWEKCGLNNTGNFPQEKDAGGWKLPVDQDENWSGNGKIRNKCSRYPASIVQVTTVTCSRLKRGQCVCLGAYLGTKVPRW